MPRCVRRERHQGAQHLARTTVCFLRRDRPATGRGGMQLVSVTFQIPGPAGCLHRQQLDHICAQTNIAALKNSYIMRCHSHQLRIWGDAMKLPQLEYICAGTLAQAIELLAAHGGEAKVIAGGQSLMPMLAFRLATPKLLVDIGRLPGLKQIDIGADGLHIGALVTWRDIERDDRLAHAHPLLVAAIAHVAHYQIRNRGTVGGSLAHADPASELLGIAVTCDAELPIVADHVLEAAARAREVVDPPDDIHAGADYRRDLVGTLIERTLFRAAEAA